ncbi:putative cytochrome p450 protein [Neofusicoccum parvum UCRNP2]|uniref:Putative cytochrome p450 protein n=1 Tax=Botryosphaeria parva (strain UCR-NP2) TaxID=1287680 RepID=R1GF34_BOTPV|nr:putative cytochrome p450 protein [Neofusicoccum parvum UCRNP2]
MAPTTLRNNTNVWKEVDGFGFWKKIMVQVVSSIYVGKPLCHDEDYLNQAGHFNQMVIFNAGLIGATPRPLRPFVAFLLCLPDKLRFRSIARMAGPLIAERLQKVQQIAAQEKSDYSSLPHELVTWAAIDAVESPDPVKCSVDFLARRLSVMTFISTDSTSITLGNVLFDILLASKPLRDANLMEQVQEEVKAAYDHYCRTAAMNPSAGKTFIESLPLLDACLKESFRLRNFISRTLMRTATSRSGETVVPGVGYVPEGVKIGIPIWGIHHEEALYEDANTWRCERWLEDDLKQATPVTGGGSSGMPRAYAPFGFKRFSCPGRFYAVRLVKLILAYFLLHYEIKLADERRPVHYWWGISISPPREASLLIRRRNVHYTEPFIGLSSTVLDEY